MHTRLSRRDFARIAGSAAMAAPLRGQRAPLTAQQAIERIDKSIAITAGDPQTPVHGMATTAMATLDVLTRASRENANLIVTLEPVFFGRADTPLPDDPVYLGKKEFIRKNRLVVCRIGNFWRARKPDPFAVGLAEALAWKRYQVGDDPSRYDLPAGTLGALAERLKAQLQARAGIRVIGDPQTRVRRIVLLPGVSPLAATMKSLPECDVAIAGETREWESVEYAQDTVAAGQQKGMIMLGRVLSEEPGMNVCAQWLKTLVPEAPVRWIPAGDPYWRPA
ncbi:MAG: Nif3-like dinuclear metal center hexameric protein [Candidatus Sulfopaludibacter sp.]|nr:Nif3-like dinuclear metal center hexameric protein [Candidatus Sulfopaludibacter sp.]